MDTYHGPTNQKVEFVISSLSINKPHWNQPVTNGAITSSHTVYKILEMFISVMKHTTQATILTCCNQGRPCTNEFERDWKTKHIPTTKLCKNRISEMLYINSKSLHPGKASQTERISARDTGVYKPNHLQTVGRQRQKQNKQRDLQFASTITYMLWAGKGRNSISKGICSLQAESLTHCGKAKAEKP